MDGLNELLSRYLCDGDAAAMEEIVARTRGRLLGAARKIGSPQDAEDSVQATYHALLRRGDRPLDAPLIAWLLTVVVRIAYRRKAIDKRQSELAQRLALPNEDAGPLRRAQSTERGELLRAEVARLPAKYRDVLVLRYFEGLSRAECGALLDCSEQTVKTRLRRARELLHGRLHPRFRHALFVAPWFLIDTASASPALGVVMKSKVGIVVVLLALSGLIGVATNALRDGGQDETHRAAAPSDPLNRAPDSVPEPEVPLNEFESGRESFDLATADRDRDVHGIVVTEGGAPVAAARIHIVTLPWRRANTMNFKQYHATEPGPTIESARDGTFILPWKRGRVGELRVEAAGFARQWVEQVQAGERLRVVITRGATVNVSVVDAAGRPADGVKLVLRVDAGAYPGPFARAESSDAEGRARFSGVSGNRLQWIVATSSKYGRPGWARVQVPGKGGAVDVAIRMRPLRVVTGRVTDAKTGDPIPGARVGVLWIDADSAVTDSHGRYEVSAWRTDATVNLTVSAAGYGGARSPLGPADVLDFSLVRGDRITGRVVDERGQPVAGVRIAALGTVVGETPFTNRGHATSGPDGRFTVGGLRRDATHVVAFLAPGYGRMLVDVAPAPDVGGLVDIGDAVLRPGRSIAGRVIDAEGDPAQRVSVTVKGANAARERIGTWGRRWLGGHAEQEMRETDDLGRFRFPDLAAGSYRISVTRPGGTRMTRDVVLTDDADVTDVEIQFDATRTFDILVVDPEGRGVPDAFFSVQHEGGVQGGRTDERGYVQLQVKGVIQLLQLNFVNGLPKDVVYQLPFKRENLGVHIKQLRVELKRAALVRGVVLLPDGKPVYKPMIEVRQGDRVLRSVLGKEDGSFRAEVPAEGTADLVFKGRGIRGSRGLDMNVPFAGRLDGVTAGATGLRLQLIEVDKQRSVVVRLLDPDGKPLANMRVMTSQQQRFFETDADGRVTLRGLVAKAMTVTAFPDTERAPGLVPPRPTELVPDGQEVEIRFLKGRPLRGSVVRPEGAKGNIFVVVRSGDKPAGTGNCDADGRFVVYIDPAAGDGPFEVQAVHPSVGTAKGHHGKVDGVMLDGPEPRIEMK